MDATIEKVSIIVSKGSLEGIYPALIMANGARAEGIEANLFFTFFGLDAITKKRHEHVKVATVGNPGLHLATIVGALPGMPGLMTSYLEHKMTKLDIPPIPEFIEMISDSGAGLYGCLASHPPARPDRPVTATSWQPHAIPAGHDQPGALCGGPPDRPAAMTASRTIRTPDQMARARRAAACDRRTWRATSYSSGALPGARP